MDETVRRLTTPEECEQFIKNVQEQYPALAIEARRKAVELRMQCTEPRQLRKEKRFGPCMRMKRPCRPREGVRQKPHVHGR